MIEFALYYYESCPFCQRVLRPLRQNRWQVTLHDIMKNEQDYKDLIAGGGRSTVPCLRIKDTNGKETWMYESLDILSLLQNHFKN
jgi:glutaredoxin